MLLVTEPRYLVLKHIPCEWETASSIGPKAHSWNALNPCNSANQSHNSDRNRHNLHPCLPSEHSSDLQFWALHSYLASVRTFFYKPDQRLGILHYITQYDLSQKICTIMPLFVFRRPSKFCGTAWGRCENMKRLHLLRWLDTQVGICVNRAIRIKAGSFDFERVTSFSYWNF